MRLPDVTDNLEARLILLRRRMSEQASGLELQKSGRGQLRLVVSRPIELLEVSAG
jgi:adenylate cyclase